MGRVATGAGMMLGLSADEMIAAQRAALLIIPMAAAAALLLAVKPTVREATAAMTAFLWQLPALLALHLLAQYFGWWRFAATSDELLGLPLDVWIGWALWWGPVAVFLNRWLSAPLILLLQATIDLVAMPLLSPLLVLADRWWIGEAPALMIGLAPGLLIANLTRLDQRPQLRATLHSFGWGGYMLLVLPACALAFEGRSYIALLAPPESWRWLIAGAILFLLFVGVIATAEFARVGHGTPIPLDPPKRVVTTGPYAFIANPMQAISALVMLLIALYAQSWAIAFVGVMFLVFDIVYADWYNRAHIANTMPTDWSAFKANVPGWRSQWRPYVAGAAVVMIVPNGLARRIWDWIWPHFARRLLSPIDVREYDQDQRGRLLYIRAEAGVRDHGMMALARIIEHGPLPIAIVGWLIRFPVIAAAMQALSAAAVRVYRDRFLADARS